MIPFIHSQVEPNRFVKAQVTTLLTIYFIISLAPNIDAREIIFNDNFNSKASYHEVLVKNATAREYGDNALAEGHLLRKWNYNWQYAYSGEWTQTFYVVPSGKDYMEQAGRSAHFGHYELITITSIPDEAKKYEIKFRQFKNDNDAISYHFGCDANGDGGVRFGYMNQVASTDSTVNWIYTEGDLGESVIEGKTYLRQWIDHVFTVDLTKKSMTWQVNGEVIFTSVFDKLKNRILCLVPEMRTRNTL